MAGEGDVALEERAFSSLVALSNFLGMPIEGFEEEILTLLNKIKKRKGREGQALSKRTSKFVSSYFERELKKLEWFVKY